MLPGEAKIFAIEMNTGGIVRGPGYCMLQRAHICCRNKGTGRW